MEKIYISCEILLYAGRFLQETELVQRIGHYTGGNGGLRVFIKPIAD